MAEFSTSAEVVALGSEEATKGTSKGLQSFIFVLSGKTLTKGGPSFDFLNTLEEQIPSVNTVGIK